MRASTVEGENEEEQVKSDGNNNNFNGGDDQFKRAPGEDQEKFRNPSPIRLFRKRIQPLPVSLACPIEPPERNRIYRLIKPRIEQGRMRLRPLLLLLRQERVVVSRRLRRGVPSITCRRRNPVPTPPKSPFAASSAARHQHAILAVCESFFCHQRECISDGADEAGYKGEESIQRTGQRTHAVWQPMKVDKPKEVKFEIPKVSFGQIFIVLSFTTIIGLMIGTFWVVWNSENIRFNGTMKREKRRICV